MLRHQGERIVKTSWRILRPTFGRRLLSSTTAATTQQHWLFDCTGRAVSCSHDNLNAVNSVVTNIITGNEKYTHLYDQLVGENDSGGILTLSLALIDRTRSACRDTQSTRQELRQRLLSQTISKFLSPPPIMILS
jgi:hypothetical protein